MKTAPTLTALLLVLLGLSLAGCNSELIGEADIDVPSASEAEAQANEEINEDNLEDELEELEDELDEDWNDG